MACKCLSRYLEDRVVHLSDLYYSQPRWRVFRRRRLWDRMIVLMDVLRAVYEAEAPE